MAIVNANDLQLKIINSDSGTKVVVAHAQTVSLDFSNSTIDVTTKSSNSWMEKISGQKSFSLSTDGLLDYDGPSGESDVPDVTAWAFAGTEVYFDFGIGDSQYQGSGFITSFSQSGGTDDAPTYSISIDGNGELTYDDDITD